MYFSSVDMDMMDMMAMFMGAFEGLDGFEDNLLGGGGRGGSGNTMFMEFSGPGGFLSSTMGMGLGPAGMMGM